MKCHSWCSELSSQIMPVYFRVRKKLCACDCAHCTFCSGVHAYAHAHVAALCMCSVRAGCCFAAYMQCVLKYIVHSPYDSGSYTKVTFDAFFVVLMLLFSLAFSSLPYVLSLLIVLYSVLYLYEVLTVCYVAILAFGWCARLLAGVFVVLIRFCVVFLCERNE